MLFSSPEFLFGFLPLFLILYSCAYRGGRNLILFLFSLLFYFMTSAEMTLILIFSVLFNYVIALAVENSTENRRKSWLVLGIIANLAPLLYYKYAHFAAQSIQDCAQALGVTLKIPEINPPLPIGISFFTFQAISYVVDIYLGRVAAARNVIDFGMYHSCFPQLIAGPIVRYEEIEPQVHSRHYTLSDVQNGVVRFCFGLGKKVILADNMGIVADHVFKVPAAALDPALAWIGIIGYTLQIYFDFSGYSDMAIGLGRILGFPYPENFDQPYRSLSVTEFWRRWHMTLSRWFRDYLYIPLGGNRAGAGRTLLNLLLVFFLCGLWHGAAYTFVIWGLYHGTLLTAERLLRHWPKPMLPDIVRWAYTMIVVMISWVFFRSGSLGSAMSFIATMFDVRHLALSQSVIATLTSDKLTYMALAIVVALAPFRRLASFANGRHEFGFGLSALSIAVAVFSCVLMSVNGFSPFIYFKF